MPEETKQPQENVVNEPETEELDEESLEQVGGGVAGGPGVDKTVQSYYKIEFEDIFPS